MTSEELLDLGIYCPTVFDDRIIIYLKLGFNVLLLYNYNKKKHYFYLFNYTNKGFPEPINYNKLHIIKDTTVIYKVTNLVNVPSWSDRKFSVGKLPIIINKDTLIYSVDTRFYQRSIYDIDGFRQYINNFRYGHSD